ncbi:MAG: enoyl-CoA hydratase/isomerase family protein [Paracoccaceae bacterium]|nr:enoyl-CoA hydratase/isomerase family protein [Paracoccaceae bacterium]
MTENRIHPHLVLSRRGRVSELRIDRQEALGALNLDIMQALRRFTSSLRSDPDCRVLILTGTGKGFVAGADISGYHGASQAEFDGFQRMSRETFDAFASLPQITICAVNGYALGGGFELALCCDFILVSEKAKLGLPEIKLGLLPGGGGTQRLTRLVGRMRAKELILTGRFLSAAEAVEMGVAIRSQPPDGLMDDARGLARQLAEQAPLALAEGKRVIDDGVDAPLATALTFEQRVLGGLFASEDGREGIAAFIEKRPPEFGASTSVAETKAETATAKERHG